MFKANTQIYKTTTKSLLENVNQIQVLEYYLNCQIDLNVNICSPIRTDPNPGCRWSIDSDGNLILFDYSKGTSYNIISVVASKLGISYMDAMTEIQTNFVVRVVNYVKPPKIEVPERIPFKVYVKKNEISQKDVDYWSIGDINFKKEYFEMFYISNIKVYSINNVVFTPQLAYLYHHPGFVQIFRPDLRKDAIGLEARYRANTMLGLHGKEFVKHFDWVYVTKSVADWTYLQVLGINSLFVLKEGHKYLPGEVAYLMKFKKVILLYDGDKTGIQNMEKLQKEFGWDIFYYKEENDTKDMLKKYKSESVKQILMNKVNGR